MDEREGKQRVRRERDEGKKFREEKEKLVRMLIDRDHFLLRINGFDFQRKRKEVEGEEIKMEDEASEEEGVDFRIIMTEKFNKPVINKERKNYKERIKMALMSNNFLRSLKTKEISERIK
uniref:Uncharacterized protein n=1 Tax=Euplotes harpa TaxID=151035 RepID=A0A7S3N5U0_9SPIT|mmetsp:Transcript_14669/g.16936  ORF Transcript_14669/g.16936 Transcript_14669/m.16936 type:complete len:120 (+) Transcript_14669:2-361(+)